MQFTLRHEFKDPLLLELALRHRSWCAENGGVESNERLEFLGDAVLGVVITDHLYRSTPNEPEGVLARYRAELVNSSVLALLARRIDLGSMLLLGKGEEATGGRDKNSILADALEALIGAIYLDAGTEAAEAFILELSEDLIEQVENEDLSTDHKSRLQETAARLFGELPRYDLSEDGPEHAKSFTARVTVRGRLLGEGIGRTKKEAEQGAARQAEAVLESGADAEVEGPGTTEANSGSTKRAADERVDPGDQSGLVGTNGENDG